MGLLPEIQKGAVSSAAQCNFVTSQFYRVNSSQFGLSFPNGKQAGRTNRPLNAAGLQCSTV
jgi:hypothetical protein